MRALASLALGLLVASLSVVCAQTIPPGEMAGRERFRFQDSPADRFMKPGPYATPDVIDRSHVKPTRGTRKTKKKRS